MNKDNTLIRKTLQNDVIKITTPQTSITIKLDQAREMAVSGSKV
jgi:hypothetical protein